MMRENAIGEFNVDALSDWSFRMRVIRTNDTSSPTN